MPKPPYSVLIADDDGATRFGLVNFLRSTLGVDATYEAQRLSDAFAILENDPVDLAIFDLSMPGVKSPKDLAVVRQRWPAVRVVVFSASDRRSNILAALEAGVHGYIVKASTMDGLADRLGYVMRGEIYVPPCLAEMQTSGDALSLAPANRLQPVQQKLTLRQRQVLRAIVKGHSNKQIAKELKLAVGTVKMHVSGMMSALGAQNRSHAASLGRQLLD